jgi:hypothetical protein
MFTVKWVIHGRESEPVESEEFRGLHSEVIVEACKLRLPTMRIPLPATPTDGFLVLDSREREVCRWFGRRPT